MQIQDKCLPGRAGTGVVTVTLNPCLDKLVTVKSLRPYELNRVGKTRTDPSGKGINVARVLSTAVKPVTATGLLGRRGGEMLLEFMEQAGVRADFVEIPGEVRVNLKVLDEGVNKITEINESGIPVSGGEIDAFLCRFEELTRGACAAVCSGSLPPGAPAAIYRDCLDIARKNGALTVLDCDGPALREGLAARPDLIKPNLRELEGLCGRALSGKEEAAAEALKLTAGGIGTVVVSMGAEGAVAARGREACGTSPFPVPVLSPTGAGDSMVAALVLSLLRGFGLVEAARFATAAGTLTASLPGTRLCDLEEALRFAGKVPAAAL